MTRLWSSDPWPVFLKQTFRPGFEVSSPGGTPRGNTVRGWQAALKGVCEGLIYLPKDMGLASDFQRHPRNFETGPERRPLCPRFCAHGVQPVLSRVPHSFSAAIYGFHIRAKPSGIHVYFLLWGFETGPFIKIIQSRVRAERGLWII